MKRVIHSFFLIALAIAYLTVARAASIIPEPPATPSRSARDSGRKKEAEPEEAYGGNAQ